MDLDDIPGIRFLKIKAATSYLELIMKARKIFLHLLLIPASVLLMCVSLILIGLAFLHGFNMVIFFLGMGILLVSGTLIGILAAQKTWMRMFGVDELIENIKKGDAK